MPQMANITVKKNDGTTDIVWTQKVASAGEKSAAIWRSDTVAAAAANRPSMTAVSQPNGPRTARRVTVKISYPSLVTGTDGKVSITDTAILSVEAVVPLGMADTDVNEWASQSANLIASALMKDTFKSGFAPT